MVRSIDQHIHYKYGAKRKAGRRYVLGTLHVCCDPPNQKLSYKTETKKDAEDYSFHLLLETIELEFNTVQTAIAPIIPAHTLDGGIGESSGEERGREPSRGNSRAGELGNGGSNVWFEPRGIAANIAAVSTLLELLHALALMERVEGGISGHVEGHTGEDEEEGMSHEGGRSLGKADLLVEGLLEKGLGGVVGKCKATGNTDDVLRACSPKLFAHFTIEEAVEVSIVHLLGRMLCVVAT